MGLAQHFVLSGGVILGLLFAPVEAAAGGSAQLTSLDDAQLAAVIDEVAPQVETLMGITVDTSLIRARVLPQRAVRREQLREHLVTLGVSGGLLSASLGAAERQPLSGRAQGIRQVMEKLSTASLLPATRQMVIPSEQVRRMNLDELRANVAHELVHVGQLQSHPRFFESKARLERQLAAASVSQPALVPALEQRHTARMTLLESHARLIEERARTALFPAARFQGPRTAPSSAALREKQAFYKQTEIVERLERQGLLARAFRDDYAAELLFRKGGSVYIELPASYDSGIARRRVEAYAQLHALGLKACDFAVFQNGELLHGAPAAPRR